MLRFEKKGDSMNINFNHYRDMMFFRQITVRSINIPTDFVHFKFTNVQENHMDMIRTFAIELLKNHKIQTFHLAF